MRLRNFCLSALLCAMSAPGIFAQQATAGSSVPRLVSFGVIKDAAGKPVNGALPVTFSLFAEQEGGTALWTETQVVNTDAQDHYSVFLGAMNPAGLPLDLFTSGAARWLAVEPGVPGAIDGARVLLVGVPYALKAADADTLGGKPASAFLTVAPQAQPASATVIGAAPQSGLNPALAGTGTTDFVPLWTSGTNLGNSILFQSGSIMEVKGTLELSNAGTATTSTGYDSEPFDLFASVYNSSVHEAVPQHFRWLAEPVGNDTTAASGKLDLLYGSGTSAPAETGLSISSKGVLTFASGQTFPGAGPGTIKGVTAGTDLTGGGTSGVVTLNVDTTKVPQLKAANTFTGNQSVTGSLTTSTGVYSDYGAFQGNGVYAYGLTDGLEVYETGDANLDSAVYANAEGSTTNTIGVYASTASPAGSGVYGVKVATSSEGATVGNSAGVWGDLTS